MSHGTWHATDDEMGLFASGRLPGKERQRLIRHLLSGCGQCLDRARELAFPEERQSADYTGLLRRLDLAYVVASNDIREERSHAAADGAIASPSSRQDSGSGRSATTPHSKAGVCSIYS